MKTAEVERRIKALEKDVEILRLECERLAQIKDPCDVIGRWEDVILPPPVKPNEKLRTLIVRW